MYKIISLFFFIAGLVLFFAPEYVSDFVSQDTMKMIYEYHKILGFGIIAIAYYVYTLEESNVYTLEESNYTPMSINNTKSFSNRLPTSEKITELS